jgi:transposase
MEKLPRQKYTKEFREQAVRLVIEQALTVPEAAKRLSMSSQTLTNWVFKARHGKLAGIDANRKPVTDLEAENSKLKRELAEARMERDILKKATAYFAKASLPGTHS